MGITVVHIIILFTCISIVIGSRAMPLTCNKHLVYYAHLNLGVLCSNRSPFVLWVPGNNDNGNVR